jgi:hypothetical protein
MITVQPQQIDKQLYWVLVVILLLLFGKYGIQAVQFVLMRLYEFFIQHTLVKI